MQQLVLTQAYRVRVWCRHRVLDIFYTRLEVVGGEPDCTKLKEYVKRKYSPQRVLAFIDNINHIIDIMIY